jgi:hypothetical protein
MSGCVVQRCGYQEIDEGRRRQAPGRSAADDGEERYHRFEFEPGKKSTRARISSSMSLADFRLDAVGKSLERDA